MLDLINGLPVHPLVVHAVVVLLPLSVIGVIAIAARPAWRRTYGPLVLAVVLVGTLLTPIAAGSGEALEKRVGNPGEHAELGETLIRFVVPLLILTAALVYTAFRGGEATTGAPKQGAVVTVIAVLAVVVSIGTAVQVYRIGDSGAQAVWSGEVASTSP